MNTELRLLDIDYVIDEEPIIRLFGTNNGKKIIVLINDFKPYFYLIINENKKEKLKNEIKKIKTEKHHVTSITEEKLFDHGKEAYCLKVSVNEPSGVYPIAKEASDIEGVLAKREADIKYVKRYMIDKGIRPTDKIRVTGKEVKKGVIEAEKIELLEDCEWNPKALAFDIETYSHNKRTSNSKKDPVIMISLYGAGHKEVLITKPCKDKRARVYEDEESMLKEFSKIIKDEKPDLIISYNGDNFDLPYLRERMNQYKIKMDWGLDGSNIKLIKRQVKTVARIKGIVNLDLFQFIKRIISKNLKTNTLKLDAVAHELLGKGKVENDWIQFFKHWEEGRTEELIDYSYNDAKVTYELFNKLKPLIIELSHISQQTMYDTTRSSYSGLVENYLMSESKDKKQLIPNKPSRTNVYERRKIPRFQGGYVYEPKPGIYENIAVMDFRSLYPSIIVTYNICPTTINCKCCKTRFCKKKKGFIPEMVNKILERRANIKNKLKKKKDPVLLAESNALKTIINATYGYLGFPNARWFCFECAERITEIGRNTIKETMIKASKKGFKVVYGDTDSVFLITKGDTKEKANTFLDEVNKDFPGIIELELEGFFKRGLFVSVKEKERGAKKKYALIDEKGNLVIKGFASIRGDWADIARKTQIKVFNALLKDNDKEKAVKIINKTINKLKNGKANINDLIIRRQLTKPISEYKTIGPHVVVAKKLLESGHEITPGTIIEYIVTEGKGRIKDKAKPVFELKEQKLKYDASYYINNQLIPSIDKIMELLGIKEENIEGEQKKLNQYFK